jgi:hypothetical protein
LDFSDFVSAYRAGTVQVHVDRSQAMRVCGDSPALPRRYRNAHLIGRNTSVLLVLGGLISVIWIPWWASLAAVVLGLLLAPRVQKSAARFVLQYSLEDEAFFRQMLEAGVLVLDTESANGGMAPARTGAHCAERPPNESDGS